MDASRWERVKRAFQEALEQPPRERASYLRALCGNDPGLRAEVESLLATHEQVGTFGEEPANELLDGLSVAVDSRMSMSAADLQPGRRLGVYEVQSMLGAGGMGEVYKARDTRLDRIVAIKILPAHLAVDSDRYRRFEREARAVASLDHPHIGALYDVGEHDGLHFLVMQYLEGETLAARLAKGALPLDQVLRYAIEVAEALDHAHRRGIVHRDLKPGNIFLTKSGAKLLDFGLAKWRAVAAGGAASGFAAPTHAPDSLTEKGMIVGTLHYMAPEQLEGKDVDARADLFAFGAVLFEMLTGRKAFDGGSQATIIASVLGDDPPPLSTIQPLSPPALDRLARKCLAKDPDLRWQTARDLTDELKWIVERAGDGLPAPAATARRSTTQWRAALAVALVALAAVIAGGLVVIERLPQAPLPSFNQLTFRRGMIFHARFASGGRTILYGARWDGRTTRALLTTPEGNESRPLGYDADVVAVSRRDELALLVHHRPSGARFATGTLARAPLTGGAPREILENVAAADWAPDADNLAVVHWVEDVDQIEYPIGNVLYRRSSPAGFIDGVRLAPAGDAVAFLLHPSTGAPAGDVAIVDRTRKLRILSRGWHAIEGLAWAPAGDKLWFAASTDSDNMSLYSVSLSGSVQAHVPGMGHQILQDVAPDGRLLVTHRAGETEIMTLAPGASHETNLAWLDLGWPTGLSDDGTLMLFNEIGSGAGGKSVIFVRRTDGSPPIRLGEGAGLALSPDGKRVLATTQLTRDRLIELPVGPGQPSSIPPFDISRYAEAQYMPDGKAVIFRATARGQTRQQVFIQPLDGGPPSVVQSATDFHAVSPNGRRVLVDVRDADHEMPHHVLQTIGGAATPVNIPADVYRPLRFSGDGRGIFLSREGIPLSPDTSGMRLYRYDIATDQISLWRTFAMRVDPVGIPVAIEPSADFVTPDGRSYVSFRMRFFDQLYLISGAR